VGMGGFWGVGGGAPFLSITDERERGGGRKGGFCNSDELKGPLVSSRVWEESGWGRERGGNGIFPPPETGINRDGLFSCI